MLRKFCKEELGVNAEDCYHRHHPNDKTEFLWDFIASQKDSGILVVAESEQQSGNANELRGLKHDFEKLLYVFAPIRILICKHRKPEAAQTLLKELQDYSGECCVAFNPGAVFLVHFGWWNDLGSESYIWQCEGEPTKVKMVTMKFKPLKKATNRTSKSLMQAR